MSRTFFLAVAVASLLNGCTGAPPISRKGISAEAAGEQTLPGLSGTGAQEAVDGFTNDIGGFMPVKKPVRRGDDDEDGIRVVVDGRKRGALPLVTTLRKSGRHQIRLEVPGLDPFTLIFVDPVRVRTPQGDFEAWPPVILDKQTGEIFTSLDTSGVDLDRKNGTKSEIDLAKKAGRDPLLIVTTTDEPQPDWRKIGQLRGKGSVGGN